MLKRGLLLSLFLISIVLFSSFVIAQVDSVEENGDLLCVSCGDSCVTSEFASAALCNPPTNGEPICGSENGECIVLGFEDSENHGGDVNSRCEDLIDAGACESRKGCESIFSGPSFCEGAACTTDVAWVGCRYKYDDDFDEVRKEYDDEDIDPGITPDSIFYFLDGTFGDTREEKIAEVDAMIEKGDFESARKALVKYMEHAESFEEDPDPERREEARRSAAAIHRILEEIKEKIPEEEEEEFYEEILDREGGIITAVEISSKIKELCSTLSELDPDKYYEVCKSGEDSADWQIKLDKELTEKQREEAKNFGRIMSQCFKTSGKECLCEEIPFPAFANACSKAAPLAAACDIEGDEDACEKLDDLDMPELPEHLQDVFDDLEDVNEARFDLHMPSECVEAGATSPKECGRIMIENNAPEECKEALLSSGCDGERECRSICDDIMFELHSPEECIDKGITKPRECAKFMDGFRGPGKRGHFEGPRIDFDCKKIEDSTKRLDCYDKASSQAQSHRGFDDEDYTGNCMTDRDWKAKKNECRDLYGGHAGDEPIYGESGEGYECVVDAKCLDFGEGRDSFEDIKARERECADTCESENKAWDFSGGQCQCKSGDYDYSGSGSSGGDYEEYENDPDRDEYESYEDYMDEDYIPDGGQDDTDCGEGEYYECSGNSCGCKTYQEEDSGSSDDSSADSSENDNHDDGDEGNDESGDSENGESGSSGESESSGITGNVVADLEIGEDNRFLSYFFGRG